MSETLWVQMHDAGNQVWEIKDEEVEVDSSLSEISETFTWIHLTDIHWRWSESSHNKDANFRTIRENFEKDIRYFFDSILKTEPDALFITGDISNSSLKDEYKAFANILLQDIYNIFPKCPTFSVPGNHDLSRPESDVAFRWLKAFESEDFTKEREAFWNKTGEDILRVNGCFDTYDKHFLVPFVKQPASTTGNCWKDGLIKGDFSYSFLKNDLRVGIVGLNSSWRQYTDSFKENQLTADLVQLNHVIEKGFKKDHHMTILLQHHPPNWIEDVVTWSDFIEPTFDISLFGHLHEEEGNIFQSETDNSIKSRYVARSFYGKPQFGPDQKKRLFGYAVGQATIQNGILQICTWTRKANRTLRFVHPENSGYAENDGRQWPSIRLENRD